jgi:hypothetical protein
MKHLLSVLLISFLLLPSVVVAQVEPVGPTVEAGSVAPRMRTWVTAGTGATDLGKAEDAAHTSGDTGVLALGIRRDAGGTECGADDDYCGLSVNSKGATLVNIDSGRQDQHSTGILKLEDGAAANGDALVGIAAVHQTAPNSAVNVGTTGDYGALSADLATGGLFTTPITGTVKVCNTIVPDPDVYAANDIISGDSTTAPLSFPAVFKTNVNSGTLTDITITNSEIDGIAFDLCLFNATTTTSTVADQGPMTLTVADFQKLAGCWSVADGRAFADTEMYQARGVNSPIDAAAVNLFGVLRTTAAPDWAAAQTLNVCITVVQD